MPRARRIPSSRTGARRATPVVPRSAAARLEAAEALFRDFKDLTPHSYTPFTKTFDSFDEYERWRRAQRNPWLR